MIETSCLLWSAVAGQLALSPIKRRNRVYAKRQALLGELRILYTDGTGETIGTNEEWEVTEEGNYKEIEFTTGKCMMPPWIWRKFPGKKQASNR